MRPPEEVKRDLSGNGWQRPMKTWRPPNSFFLRKGLFLPPSVSIASRPREKYCKAFLTWYQIEFPKTHDLGLLLGLIASTEPSLAASLTEVARLNPYGVDMRYPGDAPEITREDAEAALRLGQDRA